jgi:hypothetical protein
VVEGVNKPDMRETVEILQGLLVVLTILQQDIAAA